MLTIKERILDETGKYVFSPKYLEFFTELGKAFDKKFKEFFKAQNYKVRKGKSDLIDYGEQCHAFSGPSDVSFYINFWPNVPDGAEAEVEARIPYTHESPGKFRFKLENDIQTNLKMLEAVFTNKDFKSLLTWKMPNFNQIIKVENNKNIFEPYKSWFDKECEKNK